MTNGIAGQPRRSAESLAREAVRVYGVHVTLAQIEDLAAEYLADRDLRLGRADPRDMTERAERLALIIDNKVGAVRLPAWVVTA